MNHDSVKVTNALVEDLVILPFSVDVGRGEMPLFVNVQKVLRVVTEGDLVPLADVIPPFVGMYDFDGTPVATFDLGLVLNREGLPPDVARTPGETRSGERRVVICEALGRPFGMVVRNTRKVSRKSNAEVLPPPKVWRDLNLNYICATTKESQGYRYMLDLEAVLTTLGIALGGGEGARSGRHLEGRRILVVEDSRLFQKLAREVLEGEGAKVEVASDGAQGLEKAMAKGSAFDLILLDVEMPVMNGVEMARRYRQEAVAPVPILFHSAITNPVLAEDIRGEGLGDYLPKFEEDAVVRRLVELLSA